MNAAQIHCELYMVVHGQNVISKRTARQWFKMIKDAQTNVHDDSEVVGRPSVIVQSVAQNFVKDGFSQFQKFLHEFPQPYALFSMGLSQLG
jgi:hypothetical protein